MTTTPSPRRVRIHVPAKDGMPETVRGVGSRVTCADCGARLSGRTHAEVRKAWRLHKLEGCASELRPSSAAVKTELPHRLEGCT